MFKDYSVTEFVMIGVMLVSYAALGVVVASLLLRPVICPAW